MRNIYLISASLLLATLSSAQNLVVNPSFEQTVTNCSQFGGEGFFTDLAGTWDNANSNTAGDSCSSPDLFSPCNEVFGISVTGMPNNELGWQYARTGERYVGIITHEPLSNYREYIQGRTTAPLVAGQQYCVSFYVSRADNVPFATNNMGVYFSNTHYQRNACPGSQNSLINVTPHLNYDCAPITDTTNWVRLQWNYTASGGEQYFVIGNFFNNANTTIVNVGGGGLHPYAYYYIDDVSIEATGECCYAEILAQGDLCLSDGPVVLNVLAPIGDDCPTTVTGTWSGTGVSAGGIFNPSTAGVGTHTATYTLSCGYQAVTEVTVNPCAELNICLNANGDLTVSGGSGSYTWESRSMVEDCSGCMFGICQFCPNGGVMTEVWTQFSTSATATPPGTWPIRVTDGQGGIVVLDGVSGLPECGETGGCDLTVYPVNVVNACNGEGGVATVDAAGGTGTITYTWDTNPVQTGPTATGLGAGEYTVTVVDGASCTETLTIVIQDGQIVADAGEDHVICKGQATTLTATGGTSYSWENGASTDQSIDVAPSSTYTFTVEVFSGSCSATAQVTVTVAEPPLIEVSTPATEFCESDGSVELQGSPAGGQFSGNGITGNTFSPSQAGVGTHTITYTYIEYEECPYTTNIWMTVDVCTDIEDPAASVSLNAYPNPTSGMLHVTGVNGNTEIVALQDALGRALDVDVRYDGSIITINMAHLSPGMYVLRAVDASGVNRAIRVFKD